ncbi:hypothetical protein JCM19037_2392 [Geomicrobium sp. JCM 19037]|uniref:DUF6176 family protein n=1 Tax=Geomicrobium sp. JCM 19037 TaxID=1460634 RepID=UPI00045F2054|nr:DUF6176 family protein [Geomicrobium sp. JCM 19037]GAK04021.1 hypothetical protein JCM19037_2392 [Geomicrobium sp. JCM 19037]
MKIELTRYPVKPGKSQTVREWMDFLNQNMEAVTETLVGEKMYVETIFSETVGETEYLYWYSVQGEGGTAVEESDHWIDHAHLRFWEECIDDSEPPVDLIQEVVMIPEPVRASMKE